MSNIGIFGSFEEAIKYADINKLDILIKPISEDAIAVKAIIINKEKIETAAKKKNKRKKMWVVFEDDKTCESCMSMNGKIIDENEYFEFEGYKLAAPPLHWMTATIKEDGSTGYKCIKNGARDKITCRCGLFYFME